MQLKKTYKQKILKSDLNKRIIWGARSIKIEINNNGSPKLFNKELNRLSPTGPAANSCRNETRDNTNTKSVAPSFITTVIPVSLKKFNNKDRIDHE